MAGGFYGGSGLFSLERMRKREMVPKSGKEGWCGEREREIVKRGEKSDRETVTGTEREQAVNVKRK